MFFLFQCKLNFKNNETEACILTLCIYFRYLCQTNYLISIKFVMIISNVSCFWLGVNHRKNHSFRILLLHFIKFIFLSLYRNTVIFLNSNLSENRKLQSLGYVYIEQKILKYWCTYLHESFFKLFIAVILKEKKSTFFHYFDMNLVKIQENYI